MAEFEKVMNDAFRMCATVSNCDTCPIFEQCIREAGFTEENISSFEGKVKEWALKNPTSEYPSWRDYWESMFPGTDIPCPKGNFGVKMTCIDFDCATECLTRPIPKHIAKKLGIKPKNAKRIMVNGREVIPPKGTKGEDA